MHGGRDLDCLVLAVEGILQRDLHVETEISTARRTGPGAATTAPPHAATHIEGVAKDLLENVGKISCAGASAKRSLTAAHATALLESGMAHAVIGGAFVRV